MLFMRAAADTRTGLIVARRSLLLRAGILVALLICLDRAVRVNRLGLP